MERLRPGSQKLGSTRQLTQESVPCQSEPAGSRDWLGAAEQTFVWEASRARHLSCRGRRVCAQTLPGFPGGQGGQLVASITSNLITGEME